MNLTKEQEAYITILEGRVNLMNAQDVCHLNLKKGERETLSFVISTYVKISKQLSRALVVTEALNERIDELEKQNKELKADLDGCADQLSAG